MCWYQQLSGRTYREMIDDFHPPNERLADR
jgi:hypothetical protein